LDTAVWICRACDTEAWIIDAESLCVALFASWTREFAIGTRRCTFTVLTNTARAQVAVVDNTVAVVINAVTNFSAAGIVTHTLKWTTNAAIGAFGASATSDTRRSNARYVVINDAIAIVVDVVANLGAWALSTLANQRAGLTNKASRITSASAVSARLACVDRRVVGYAVAIIIKTVTALRWRCHFASTYQRANHANGATKRALANIGRTANCTNIRWIIVQHTIAVIVLQVTDFGHWTDTSLTHPRTSLANEGARSAGADVGTASPTNIYCAFIDSTVTVIVDAVANFIIGPGVVTTRKASILTDDVAFVADIGVVAVARCAKSCRVVVDSAIAIIVTAITSLSYRTNGRLTLNLRGDANRDTGLARPLAWTADASLSNAVANTCVVDACQVGIDSVDQTITVVVDSIANFCLWSTWRRKPSYANQHVFEVVVTASK
jgi:hypothetical protein